MHMVILRCLAHAFDSCSFPRSCWLEILQQLKCTCLYEAGRCCQSCVLGFYLYYSCDCWCWCSQVTAIAWCCSCCVDMVKRSLLTVDQILEYCKALGWWNAVMLGSMLLEHDDSNWQNLPNSRLTIIGSIAIWRKFGNRYFRLIVK